MIISPSEPRDYNEIIQAYEQKYKVNMEKLIENKLPSELIQPSSEFEGFFLVLKSILAVNIMEYNAIIHSEKIDRRIVYLYKLIIYDYFDYCQSFSAFCGLQEYTVARSFCEHSRLFILSLCDDGFLEYYCSKYEESEKKKRFYEKKGKNISNKLREIAEKAKKLNNELEFCAESSIFNLTTELYNSLTDKLGEIAHLTEITMAQKLIPADEKLNFSFSDRQEKLKFNDKIIEYLILTTLATSLIFIAEEIQFDETVYKIYNFLNFLSEKLFNFRNIDYLLMEMTNQIREKLLIDETKEDDM